MALMEPKLTSLSVVREILSARGLAAQKRLGQNFLVDFHAREKLVDALDVTPGERVLEIGPGLGALTEGLLAKGAHVIAVEIDRGLCVHLREHFGRNIELVEGDALEEDLGKLLFPGGKVAGNLPYYISTPLVVRILEAAPDVSLLLLQQEVAERMRAGPGDPARGALSVLVEYSATIEPVLRLRPEQFFPQPKVASQAVLLRRRERPTEHAWNEIRPLVQAAFGFRRKILSGALHEGLQISRAQATEALDWAGIDHSRRGETLTLAEFDRIAGAFSVMSNQ